MNIMRLIGVFLALLHLQCEVIAATNVLQDLLKEAQGMQTWLSSTRRHLHEYPELMFQVGLSRSHLTITGVFPNPSF